MTVIPLVYLLADLGFSTYLLQTDDIDQGSLSTAFWASVAAGVAVGGLVGDRTAARGRRSGSPSSRRCSGRSCWRSCRPSWPAYRWPCCRRGMAFRAMAVQGLVAALLAQAAAVVLCAAGGGVWALVAQLVVTQWVIAVLAWRRAAWLPSLRLSPRQFRHMAAFGVRVSGVDVVATLRIWPRAGSSPWPSGPPRSACSTSASASSRSPRSSPRPRWCPSRRWCSPRSASRRTGCAAPTSRHSASPTRWSLRS